MNNSVLKHLLTLLTTKSPHPKPLSKGEGLEPLVLMSYDIFEKLSRLVVIFL